MSLPVSMRGHTSCVTCRFLSSLSPSSLGCAFWHSFHLWTSTSTIRADSSQVSWKGTVGETPTSRWCRRSVTFNLSGFSCFYSSSVVCFVVTYKKDVGRPPASTNKFSKLFCTGG